MDRPLGNQQPPQGLKRRKDVVRDEELRKQVLRERAPMGGGGARLETGNTVDTTILNSGAKLILGGGK